MSYEPLEEIAARLAFALSEALWDQPDADDHAHKALADYYAWRRGENER